MSSNFAWDVLAVAGPSGVGKSRLSYQLARHFDVPLVEVDDLFHAVEATSTPAQQPWIHYWQTHPQAAECTAQEILTRHIEVCRAMSPAIAAVIDNHIRTKMPVILEGDYILPELIATFPQRVKAVFLTEDSQEQLIQNFREREPGQGEQRGRAEVSHLFGRWLSEESDRYSLRILRARPWETVMKRVCQRM